MIHAIEHFLSENAFPVGIFIVDLFLLGYVLYLAYRDEQKLVKEKERVDHS